ncbi:MFS transporter [Marinococcus sp. PL1-022]|uniref:MFS transporter n=1 Tax=Marinococcus sp. PL1-022 TaxID=3095363 RepID=UPI0029C17294|nr:MFS transporter [Marinococcus sp. PL1-022]MDX6154180.1 MFS transporter [Marinococcus sp. PL1-022]
MSRHDHPIWTKDFISITITNFMVFTVFYSLLTTLPLFVTGNLGGTSAQGGLIVTIMLVATIITRIFAGKIMEKTGRKRAMVWGAAVFVLCTFLYLFIDTYTGLLLLRFVHGIPFGILSTATGAIAADVIPNERRGEGLGYFTTSMNVAVVIGPFIGLTLIQFAPFALLFVLLGIFMIVGVWCAAIARDPGTPAAPNTEKQKLSIHDFIELRALPIASIGLLASFSYAGVISYMSLFAEAMGLIQVSSFFFLVFAVVVIASRPVAGPLFDARGPGAVLYPCLLIFAIGLVTLSFTTAGWMLLLAAALIGLGYGTLLPGFQTMSIQAAEPHRSGHATATFFIMFDSGIALGSFFLGLLVNAVGYQYLYQITAGIILLTIGALFLYFRTSSVYAYEEKKA